MSLTQAGCIDQKCSLSSGMNEIIPNINGIWCSYFMLHTFTAGAAPQ
uniref:Uncharacterized protein n=1 Tax=Arundo donax TaxID=35708 RepID=A0A0A9HMJ9_ARUDO